MSSKIQDFVKNNRQFLYSLGAVVIMAVISLAFFFPDATDGRVLQQHDMTQGMANGQEVKEFTEKTGETSRWTNSLFGGMPNFQIAPSYDSAPWLNWIGKVYSLGLPTPCSLLFIMMLGFFIMGMCLKMRWYVSLFGAIAWGFSTYFIIIIGAGHIWKFITLAYIPPTIGGIILCYRGKYLGGAALASLFGALQLLSNHIQMTYYFLFVIAALMIGYLILAIRQKKVREWGIATGCLFVAAILAFGANCASLLNTAKYTKETIRGRSTDLVDKNAPKKAEGADFDYITQWSYGGDEMFTLMIPNVKGGASLKPEGGTSVPKNFSEKENGEIQKLPEEIREAQYQGGFTEYFGNQPMTNGPVYVGVFLLYLAIVGCFLWRGPMKWCVLGVTILSILLALGHNFGWFSRLFIDWFPFYNRFRTVSSILVIAEFTLPLLAMMALAKMLSEKDFLIKYKGVLMWTGIVMGAICLLLIIFPSLFGEGFSVEERKMIDENNLYQDEGFALWLNAVKHDRLALVRADAFRSLLFLAFGIMLLWMYGRHVIRTASVFMASMILLLLIDLFSVNKRYVDSKNFTEPIATDELMSMSDADREILKDTAMNYRVARLDNLQDANVSYYHKSVGGYHAAKLTRYNDLLTKKMAVQEPNYQVFDMLNTKYFMGYMKDASGNVSMGYQENPYAFGNAWFVDDIKVVDNANEEMDALDTTDLSHIAVADKKFASKLGEPAKIMPGDTIYETYYAPNRLKYHVNSAKGGVVVFSEVYFPWGWHATVDGKPVDISRVNYVLRAIRVPAGSHTIEMWFDPESLKTTNRLSVVSVWLIYLLCLGALAYYVVRRNPHWLNGIKKPKKQPEKKPEESDAKKE